MPANPEAESIRIGAFEAKTHLSKLLRQARSGKRFIITQRGQPVAELRAFEPDRISSKTKRGDMAGKIWISEDFCSEIDDMREHME